MEEFDLIIIGGGPAGYSAAIYAARFNLKAIVIAKLMGGLISTTHLIENYPGFISLSGTEFAQKLEDHVKSNKVPIENDIVQDITKENDYYIITTEISNKCFKTKSLILATGTKHKELEILGEKEFAGKGVSYCATCDGNFFKNKTVGIIGGSNVAAKDAMVLAKLAKKVYMFIRTHLKAEPVNCDIIKSLNNIEIIEGVNVTEIQGNQTVTNIILDKEFNGSTKVNLDGVFIAIGHIPQIELALKLGIKLNENDEIIINKYSETNIPGIMAAGDVCDLDWKQAIVSASQGAIACYSAYNYIIKKFQK